MTIDRSLVEYLEKLGRIHLSEEERSASEKDLQSILSYIDTLNELDTDGVEPASHSFPVANVMRDDKRRRYGKHFEKCSAKSRRLLCRS